MTVDVVQAKERAGQNVAGVFLLGPRSAQSKISRARTHLFRCKGVEWLLEQLIDRFAKRDVALPVNLRCVSAATDGVIGLPTFLFRLPRLAIGRSPFGFGSKRNTVAAGCVRFKKFCRPSSSLIKLASLSL